jgi:hypothetical protein
MVGLKPGPEPFGQRAFLERHRRFLELLVELGSVRKASKALKPPITHQRGFAIAKRAGYRVETRRYFGSVLIEKATGGSK